MTSTTDEEFTIVAPDELSQMSLTERAKHQMVQLAIGTGIRFTRLHLLYLLKALGYFVVGVVIARLTSGFEPGAEWWLEPIFFQKMLVWTVLIETLGLGCDFGPIAGKIKPVIGGFLYLGRPRTLRIAPWPNKVPLTSGDTRRIWDVAVYWLFVLNLVVLLVLPGEGADQVRGAHVGLLPAWGVFSAYFLLIIGGLRDKMIYMISRSDQYMVPMLLFAVLAQVDLIVALKIWIVVGWVAVSISKIGPHFTRAIPPMVSLSPWVPVAVKKRLYRNLPEDPRPSRLAWVLAHVCGTLVEMVMPLVLLFSPWTPLTWVAIGFMVAFHLFIFSTYVQAVILEWNLFFVFWTIWVFGMHLPADGWAVTDAAVLPVLVTAGLAMILPIIGQFRPDWVAFLPAMRQFAGNWATSLWAFADREKEDRMNEAIPKASAEQYHQLRAAGASDEVAEVTLSFAIAYRGLHMHGPGTLSVMGRHVDVEKSLLREGESVCDTLLGWNLGDGHLHDDRLVASVQHRCGFRPGELVVVYAESKPIHRHTIEYRVIDACLGVVERGVYKDSVVKRTVPWLRDGPIEHEVTWQAPGYRSEYDATEGLGFRFLASSPG